MQTYHSTCWHPRQPRECSAHPCTSTDSSSRHEQCHTPSSMQSNHNSLTTNVQHLLTFKQPTSRPCFGSASMPSMASIHRHRHVLAKNSGYPNIVQVPVSPSLHKAVHLTAANYLLPRLDVYQIYNDRKR
ncbi:hypothetical protein PV11_05597 [Exophiala sideris]|uniref:Uncharacterized protein n=1 Tax=Exophiala sideris TaxID=1016849 RepID=A0A0D1X701_9EURO|nr:hypothetical protein PV11_05597 [Exophiala sideris]